MALNQSSEGVTSVVYTDLAAEQGQAFRLVTIQPGRAKDAICLSLEVANLQDVPEYEALSYVWGSQTRDARIQVNQGHLYITGTLRTILVNLRDPKKTRVVWIDQISINQDDVDERSSQVRLMTKIFASSLRTLIWISEASSSTAAAFAFVALCRNRNRFERGRYLQEIGRSFIDTASLRTVFSLYRNPMNFFQMSSGYSTYAFAQLLAAPWFSRTWTFQEIVVAKAAVVVCGREQISWSELWHACDYTQSLSHDDPVWNQQPCLEIGTARQWKDVNSKAKELELVSLLSSRRKYKASDPRDKIYALLGVAHDITAEDVIPDYSRSVREVFAQVTAAIIFKKNPVNMLSFIQNDDLYELPSWVPNWDVPLNSPMLCEQSKFFYSSMHRQSEPISSHVSGMPDRLLVSGYKIVEIEKVGKLTDGFSRREHFKMIQVYCTKEYPITGEAYGDAYLAARSPQRYRESIDRARSFYRGYRSLQHYRSRPNRDSFEPEISSPNAVLSAMKKVSNATLDWHSRRCFVVTQLGFMGVAPNATLPGDVVCMLSHSTVLHVLRQVDEDGLSHRYIGECIIYGLMDGESYEGEEQWRDFVLV